MMKKALHDSEELYEHNGKVYVWNFTLYEIVEAINDTVENHPPVLDHLRKWVNRYLKEGMTEQLLNDLNAKIAQIAFSKIISPSDIFSMNIEEIQKTYICRNQSISTPEVYAANDFSKLLTSGELNKIKSCSLEGCKNIFVGRPQSKWCSKLCGSKYRVRKKRKLDSQ